MNELNIVWPINTLHFIELFTKLESIDLTAYFTILIDFYAILVRIEKFRFVHSIDCEIRVEYFVFRCVILQMKEEKNEREREK